MPTHGAGWNGLPACNVGYCCTNPKAITQATFNQGYGTFLKDGSSSTYLSFNPIYWDFKDDDNLSKSSMFYYYCASHVSITVTYVSGNEQSRFADRIQIYSSSNYRYLEILKTETISNIPYSYQLFVTFTWSETSTTGGTITHSFDSDPFTIDVVCSLTNSVSNVNII